MKSWTRTAAAGSLFLLASCGPDAAGPVTGEPAAGKAAFAGSCSGCHTTRDGYDIAYFGFARSDIVRRALTHVDQKTADDIADYVKSLGVASVGRDSPPFQPGPALTDDVEFWTVAFGTSTWNADISVAAIRALNPRAMKPPRSLLPWSSEDNDADWLPETPLAPGLRAASNGALQNAIDSYYSAPTTANLLAAVAAFRSVADVDASALCYGEAGTHTKPRDCFEARRWMSVFAAQHFLRPGAPAVPLEVADLWWSTGQVAVTVYLKEPGLPRNMVWGWLYLAYTYSPTRFNEDNSYLGQFLASDGLPRTAAFTALRRMVDEAETHNALPGQRFWDAALAIGRAPSALRPDLAEWCFKFLNDWTTFHPVAAADRALAGQYLGLAYDRALESAGVPEAQRLRLTQARDQLLARLQ